MKREGNKVRKENFEKRMQELEERIKVLKKPTIITESQQIALREKLEQALEILGGNKDVTLLYNQRELENIKDVLKKIK